jgi:hypothetical protein
MAQVGVSKLDTSSNESILTWINDLFAPGVVVTDDSILITDEANKLLTDSAYKALIYPKVYTWEQVVKFIQNQELKPAFWYLINLYPIDEKNKNMAVKSILAYDSIFKMDKMLPIVFATYSLMDPEIGNTKDGHSVITAPHIMEKKLQVVKELLYYVAKNKSLQKK